MYFTNETCSSSGPLWPSYNPVRGWETGTTIVTLAEPYGDPVRIMSLSFAPDQYGPWRPGAVSNVSVAPAGPGGV